MSKYCTFEGRWRGALRVTGQLFTRLVNSMWECWQVSLAKFKVAVTCTAGPFFLYVDIPSSKEPLVDHSGCRGKGPFCREPRAIERSLFSSLIGQNIALHASPIARNSTVLFYAFLVHSTSFVPILFMYKMTYIITVNWAFAWDMMNSFLTPPSVNFTPLLSLRCVGQRYKQGMPIWNVKLLQEGKRRERWWIQWRGRGDRR